MDPRLRAAGAVWLWLAPPPAALGCGGGGDASASATAASGSASAPAPSAAPTPPPPPAASSTAAASAAPRTRSRGAVSGSLRFDAERYALGAPILLEIELKSTGGAPLVFDDRRWRLAWLVRDASGAVVCEAGGSPGRFGDGHVGTLRLAPGEGHRETWLANGACDAFARPGRYRVSVVRGLGTDRAESPRRDCEPLLGRDAPAPAGAAPCPQDLAGHPALAADLALEILPWDRQALAARVERVADERRAAWSAKDLTREGALSAYADWFCSHVRCSCPPTWERHGDGSVKALARVPERMGEGCR